MTVLDFDAPIRKSHHGDPDWIQVLGLDGKVLVVVGNFLQVCLDEMLFPKTI